MPKKIYRYVQIIDGIKVVSPWYDASKVTIMQMCMSGCEMNLFDIEWHIEWKDVEE